MIAFLMLMLGYSDLTSAVTRRQSGVILIVLCCSLDHHKKKRVFKWFEQILCQLLTFESQG